MKYLFIACMVVIWWAMFAPLNPQWGKPSPLLTATVWTVLNLCFFIVLSRKGAETHTNTHNKKNSQPQKQKHNDK